MTEAPRHRRPCDASACLRTRRRGPARPEGRSAPHARLGLAAHIAHSLAPLAARSLARLAGAFVYARAGAPRFRKPAAGFAAAIAAFSLASAPAAFGAPAAGTPIDNTASGTATDALTSATVRPVSNTVRATVQPLEALRLTPHPPLTARPGDVVTFAHRLRNAGNAPSDYRLDLANAPGDGFDLGSLALLLDLDADGVADGTDLPLTIGGTLPLAAGDSAALLVTGVVPANAPGLSQAFVALAATSLAQNATESTADTVHTPVLGPPPTLAFFTAPDFSQTTTRSRLGAPLFLQALAPQADVNAAVPDTVLLRLETRLTGDVDEFLAVETGAHTGTFRIVPAVTSLARPNEATALAGDGVVTLQRGEQVTATLFGWGAPATRAMVWVDPAGIVFDARTNAPLPGARVQLVDVTGGGNGGRAGALAVVYAADGVTPSPADVVSDAGGRYEFPWVAPSTYRLLVTPPAPYRFPSLTPLESLPGGRVLDAGGSFGLPFPLVDDGSPVVMDLPVDDVQPVVLFAEKAASRPEAEIGDDVGYQVRVANRSDSTVAALVVRDALPSGFAYVAGTARLGGLPLAEPARTGGGLVFALGPLGPRATATLSYRVRVGPGASIGDALNRAVAEGSQVRSNEAVARVTVRGGIFADEGTILGTVGLDANADGVFAPGEPGLAGVRLVLDDGTWAITDARGRYSFTGVTPRTHALKVDPATVPAAAVLIALDHRTGGQPGLRFVDLTRGELVRADFAAQGDTATLHDVLERRIAGGRSETDRLLARGSDPLTPPVPVADARALPASRVLTGESSLGPATNARTAAAAPGAAVSTAVWPPAPEAVPGAPASALVRGEAPALATGVPADSAARSAPAAPASVPVASLPPALLAAAPLEQLLPGLDAELGFVGLADLDTVAVTQIAVRVKGGAGTRLVLRVNGRTQPDSRVARRVVATESGVEAWEYLGIALQPGVNVLEVAPPHSLGRIAVRLVAPGPLAALRLAAPRTTPADGFTAADVALALVDARGVPVGARTLVTLEATLGRLRLTDLDPATPGVQIAVEGGRAHVLVEGPPSPGVARLTAATGELRAAADVRFTTELRPLLAVGTLEGVVGWNGFSRRSDGADTREARFEAPIEQFASTSRDGRLTAATHGALYMKGRVAGPWSLTLGYDSDRERDARRFRDVQPDQGYAVVGDASVRGYDAQSTGRLYTRLERPGAWLLYGDYVTSGIGTSESSGSRSLAAYSRSFSGAQSHWETGPWRVDAFTSRDRTRSHTDELPGLGISGPYQLRVVPLVENTERVEILVRDREHPGVVLATMPRDRFTDYELEPFTGRLLFRSPVPSLDANLNPVSVRVTYEVRTDDGGPGGDPFWVHGANARWQATPKLELASTFVDDHDPAAPRELRGASFRAQVAARTTVEAEWALARKLGTPSGQGVRVELTHASPALETRAWGAATGAAFDNPSAGFAGGRNEAGGRLVARLAERTRLAAEFSYSGDAAGRERRGGGLASVDHALATGVRGEFGVRLADGTRRADGEDPFVAALRAKLAWQPPAHPQWSGYAEAEQDVQGWDRRMAALGGEYRVSDRGRIYARHELISSLGSTYDLNGAQQRLATVVGMDADVRRSSHVFGEYRLADAIAGREAQAAVGLRNGWTLSPGMRLGTTFERVSALGEDRASAGATVAASAAVDFTGEMGWKGSSRIELRANRSDTQVLQSLAAAVPLDTSWTGLFRHAISVTDAHGSDADGEARARLQLGLAWRPGGPWEGLARWELRYDRGASAIAPTTFEDEPADPRRRRVANVMSLHADGRVAERDVVSLAWAGKLTREETGFAVSAGGGQWLRVRATRDVARGWDVGWNASALTGRRWSQRRWGLGAEVGRQLPMGTWLSLGFNRFGYRDDELSGEDWTREGAYLRLRMKLDESLLRRGEAPR